MEEIFGFNDQFFDERIEVAMLHLEGNDSKYNKGINKLNATLSEMFHHYYDGGKGIPEGYEERIQYFFENIQGIDNVRLRTVYFAAVVDCMNMLVKLGYIKI